jgi:predicted nucleic acid-binding protein
MVVVDTNVLGYLLLEGEQTPYARALLEQDGDWRSESFVMVEMTNVLATVMRVRRMSFKDAVVVLANAQVVMQPGLEDADHAQVLELAAHKKISAYDARFVVIARDLGTRLVTEDAKLRRAAPDLTQSIAEALAA